MTNRRSAVAGMLAAGFNLTARSAPTPVANGDPQRIGPFPGIQALARAKTALGYRTMYAMGLDIDPAKPWRNANDCSGLVLWAFGFRRSDFTGDRNIGSTDAIYADILSRNGHFVRTREPRVGGIIIDPAFQLPGDAEREFGHVGIIKSVQQRESCTGGGLATADASGGVEEKYPLEIFDCSATSWWTYGDAVRVSDYLKFLLHDKLMVAAARSGAPARDVRRPIYAVVKGEQALPASPGAKIGHCPGR